ncbi:MAG: hypothetical protein ACK5O2_00250 [Microthrixaceae bacterium]
MLRPGQKLHSAVSEAQLVVVKAPETDVEISCGGVPMLLDEPESTTAEGADLSGDGPLLGKRYAHEDLGLELLCSKAGDGALTLDGAVLEIKGAKPLPSSD